MRTWFALLLAPTLMLLDQAIALSMSEWACARQAGPAMQAIHFAFLAAVVASTFMAWQLWRETPPGGADESVARRHFLAGVATASGALSALVIAAMWLPSWALSPCFG